MKNKIMTLVLISGFAAVQASLTSEQQKRLETLWQDTATIARCLTIFEILSKKNLKPEIEVAIETFFADRPTTLKCQKFIELLQARRKTQDAKNINARAYLEAVKVMNEVEKAITEIQTNAAEEFRDFRIKNNITEQEFSDVSKKRERQERELFINELEKHLKSRGLDFKDLE